LPVVVVVVVVVWVGGVVDRGVGAGGGCSGGGRRMLRDAGELVLREGVADVLIGGVGGHARGGGPWGGILAGSIR
jgi:hypothetical protein